MNNEIIYDSVLIKKNRTILSFVNLLLAILIVVSHYTAKYIDVITWSSISPTFFVIFAVVLLIPLVPFMYALFKLIQEFRKVERTTAFWFSFPFKIQVGYFGVYAFLSLLLVAKWDSQIAPRLFNSDLKEIQYEVLVQYGQAEISSAKRIDDLIDPSYYALVGQPGSQQSIKVGICKPLYDKIRKGNLRVDVITGNSFDNTFLRSKCD